MSTVFIHVAAGRVNFVHFIGAWRDKQPVISLFTVSTWSSGRQNYMLWIKEVD